MVVKKARKRRPAPRVVKGKSGASYGTTQRPKGKAAQQKFRNRTQEVGKFVKGVFNPFPQAEAAAPTGLIVKGVGTAAKFVVKSATSQPLGKTTPLRGSTIKSETYLNQVRSGVMPSTGGGVPKFPGYPDTFAVMQSGKIDTRLLNVAGINKPNVAGGTRTYQAAVTGAPGSVKHQVKKKSFVKIKAGGPVLEFLGGTKTRFNKRTYKTVTTPSNLIQGQDPLTKKHGLDVFMATGAVAAPAASVPFWDQVSDFFNPFPQAHAVSPSIVAGGAKTIIQKFLSNNPQAKWAAFQKANQDLVKSGGITKDEFLHAQKVHNMPGFSQQIKKPGGVDPHTTGPKMSDRKSAMLAGGSVVGALGAVAAGPTIASWLDPGYYVAPVDGGPTSDKWGKYSEMQQEAGITSGTAAGAGTAITSPSELVTDVAPPGTASNITSDVRTTMQETALLNLGFDAHGQPMGSQGKAGPQPTMRYGMPSEVGQPDPSYTLIKYDKWDASANAGKGGMAKGEQWVKFGISSVKPEDMTKMLNRQALVHQTAAVFNKTQENIRSLVSKSKESNTLLATARAAAVAYSQKMQFGGKEVIVSQVIGRLPQQYQTILDREKNRGTGTAAAKAAISWHGTAPVFTEYADHPGKGITVTPSGYGTETTEDK